MVYRIYGEGTYQVVQLKKSELKYEDIVELNRNKREDSVVMESTRIIRVLTGLQESRESKYEDLVDYLGGIPHGIMKARKDNPKERLSGRKVDPSSLRVVDLTPNFVDFNEMTDASGAMVEDLGLDHPLVDMSSDSNSYFEDSSSHDNHKEFAIYDGELDLNSIFMGE